MRLHRPTGDDSAVSGPATLLVAVASVLAAVFDVRATAVGWHLAAGRGILSGGGIPRADDFSFTAGGTLWLDHEWGFQVLAAAVDSLAGTGGLIGLRAAFVVGIGLVILWSARRSGLAPAPAAVLTVLAVAGARMRFFIRPELATLVVTSVVLGLALQTPDRRPRHTWILVAATVALGANFHGGVLVVPLLLGALAAGRIIGGVVSGTGVGSSFRKDLALPLVATAATLANPWGWRLWEVPLHLADLVGRPWIPNPEWISPGPTVLPHLWVAFAIGLVLLARFERDPGRWVLAITAGALAVRYVRNVGIFFVVLGLVLAPSLAVLWGRIPAVVSLRASRLALLLAGTVTLILPLDPRYPPRIAESSSTYPASAVAFMERHGLGPARIFNDVRFGGWLIDRWYPRQRVFIDDRNELHDELLRELWEIWQSSRTDDLVELMHRWEMTTALVHYRPEVEVHSPSGEPLGTRGWSALWFPEDTWALVHWDDTAMVFVLREAHDHHWVARHEYRVIRPDDLEHLQIRWDREPTIRPAIRNELKRRLSEAPASLRAQELAEQLMLTPGVSVNRTTND